MDERFASGKGENHASPEVIRALIAHRWSILDPL
jgi:hypothetical protein